MIFILNLILVIMSFSAGLWWFYRMRQERALSLCTSIEYLFLTVFFTYSTLAYIIGVRHSVTVQHIIMHIVGDVLALLIMPVIDKIISDITKNDVSKFKKYMTLIPAITVGAINGGVYIASMFSPGIQDSYVMYINTRICYVVFVLQLLVLGYDILHTFYEYRKKVFYYYVDTDLTDFRKAHSILVCFFFIIVTAYFKLLYQRSSVDIDGNNVILLFVNLCIALIVCVVGWNMSHLSGSTVVIDANSEPYTPEEVLEMTKLVEKQEFPETEQEMMDNEYSKANPSIQAIEEIINRWTARPDKPYLKESISLAMVAKDMGLNARIISVYLNSVLLVNFNSWINLLRIEEVKRILDSKSSLPAAIIADKCGFADVSMLSKNFKKIVGMTITEYKKKNNQI